MDLQGFLHGAQSGRQYDEMDINPHDHGVIRDTHHGDHHDALHVEFHSASSRLARLHVALKQYVVGEIRGIPTLHDVESIKYA